jgi:hypothetical protein
MTVSPSPTSEASAEIGGQAARPAKRPISLWTLIAFSLSAIAAIGFFFVPAFVIRPFRYQSPRALWLAMALRQHAPAGTSIAGLVCIVLACLLWRHASLWRKISISVVILVMALAAAMSRVNYFEWMFHPIAGAQFQAQSESKLDPTEMIMSVRFGDEARAYPISQMAYHHIFNDVVDGIPIAITY